MSPHAHSLSVPCCSVQIVDAESSSPVSTIEVRGVIDVAFSPKGTQISTWERHGQLISASPLLSAARAGPWLIPARARGSSTRLDCAVKPADGEPPHKNMRVWNVKDGSEVLSLSQKSQDGWSVLRLAELARDGRRRPSLGPG